jgi:hypothetical protein
MTAAAAWFNGTTSKPPSKGWKPNSHWYVCVRATDRQKTEFGLQMTMEDVHLKLQEVLAGYRRPT